MFKIKILTIFLLLAKVTVSFAVTFESYKNNLENQYIQVNNIDFWQKRLKNLDKIILNKREIEKLNSQILMFKDSTNNIESQFNEEFVKQKILLMFHYVIKRNKYYKSSNNIQILKNNKIKNIQVNLNIENIKTILSKKYFGVIQKRCFIKAIPFNKKIIRDIKNKIFDRNIETITHIFENCRILNISKDRKWLFIVTNSCYGWIKKENIVIRDAPYKPEHFIVILKNLKKYNLKIGDILPFENNQIYLFNKNLELSKLNNNEYSIGFLPFTKRNILKLVFNMLHTPYKWGGDINGIDCSLFIKDIFRCFGINLPRNSSKQSEVLMGFNLDNIDNKNKFIIKIASPLTTLIFKKYHIMLYLGSFNNKVYIAHAFTMLKYHKGEVLITDLDFGRKNFINSFKKIIFIDK